jgi:hypothetical protein
MHLALSYGKLIARNGGRPVKKNLSTVVVCFFLTLSAANAAQQEAPAHAPDFRAPERIAPLYFPPKTRAPFIAIAKTLWVRILPDESTVTTQNERVVARDMDGRIFQERRSFIPVPNDGKQQSEIRIVNYSDPVEHKLYDCNIREKVCDLFSYHDPMMASEMPAGVQPDGKTYLTRESLGTDTFEGMEVQHSRETYTFYSQTIGNTKTILRTVEYWYSPELGVNVQVKRHDPRDGDQTLWLSNVSLSVPPPETFQVPTEYRIIDHRNAAPIRTEGNASR